MPRACPHCGAPAAPAHRFCTRCGRPLPAPPVLARASGPGAPAFPPIAATPSRRRNWFLILAAALLALCLVCCGGFVLLDQLVPDSTPQGDLSAVSNTPPATATTSPSTGAPSPARTLSPTGAPPPTPTPRPTSTRRPTSTPRPTNTLLPTYTPRPTSTPRPTATPSPTPKPQPTPTPGLTQALVTSITDGDTIHVTIAGQPYTLRYIGIDTPELDQPNGQAAREANRRLVEGQTVYLEKDVSETDRYGRLLRYVYLPDGTFVNAELVRLGYAVAKAYPPDTRYHDLFLQMQQQAEQAHRGIWIPVPLPTATNPPAQNCSPCYPGVCIPPPPPDLNCDDIPYCQFAVVGCDPHDFDGDGDGIGCDICR